MPRLEPLPGHRASLLQPVFPVLLLAVAVFLNLASCDTGRQAAPPPAVATPAAAPGPEASAPRPLGTLEVGDGAWVKLFTTLPGSKGKPATNLHTVTGAVPVYEVYDWAEHAPELAGETNHRWYRVHPEKGHWIFGLPQFTYTPAD